MYVAYWIDVVVLELISSVGQKFQRDYNGSMILVAVEAVPASSKPPAVGGVRTFIGERHSFGASAPLPNRASFLQGGAGGSVESSPKLIRYIGSCLAGAEELLSPCFARSAAALSVSLRVLVSGLTSASMAKHGCRASCSTLIFRSQHVQFLRGACSVLRKVFDVPPPPCVHPSQMYFGEWGHCLRGQPCSSSVVSQSKPRRQGHQCVCTPSPEGRSRVLRICYKEHTIDRVACRGDTWDVSRRKKTKTFAIQD